MARVRVRLPENVSVKRRPLSDSARRAECGDMWFPADGPTVLSLRPTLILKISNDQRPITQERKVVEKSFSRDCVRFAETYAAMCSPFSYDTGKFENLQAEGY